MEQLTRILSWTFVFGAIATLLYTNFKPAWKELLDSDVPAESVQGSATDPAPSPATPEGESAAAPEACDAPGKDETPAGCPRPSS